MNYAHRHAQGYRTQRRQRNTTRWLALACALLLPTSCALGLWKQKGPGPKELEPGVTFELVDGWAVYSFSPEIDPHYTHCRYLVAFREQGTTCYLRSNGEAVKAGEGRNIIQAQRDDALLAKWRE
jgi:hypothetical protein